MKFKFPLQNVVKHRKIVEDLAQKDFQDLQALHLEELEKLRQMEEALHQAHLQAGMLEKQGGTQGPALGQIHEFKKGQAVRIARQKVHVQEVEKWVEEKREILRQAAIEYKIIEKLKEKKFAEFQFESDREQQKEMDEQSILRFKKNAGKL